MIMIMIMIMIIAIMIDMIMQFADPYHDHTCTGMRMCIDHI